MAWFKKRECRINLPSVCRRINHLNIWTLTLKKKLFKNRRSGRWKHIRKISPPWLRNPRILTNYPWDRRVLSPTPVSMASTRRMATIMTTNVKSAIWTKHPNSCRRERSKYDFNFKTFFHGNPWLSKPHGVIFVLHTILKESFLCSTPFWRSHFCAPAIFWRSHFLNTGSMPVKRNYGIRIMRRKIRRRYWKTWPQNKTFMSSSRWW